MKRFRDSDREEFLREKDIKRAKRVEEYVEKIRRESRREFEANNRKLAAQKREINDRLFGPPVRIDRKLEQKIRQIFGCEEANSSKTEGETKIKKISIEEYRSRREASVEFVVTLPEDYEELKNSKYLKPEFFTQDDIYSCVRAAIRTLPRHVANAFTVSKYLWPKQLSVKPAEYWTYGIIGFDPHVPPPVREAPAYKLKNNYRVPQPANERQHHFWRKQWTRLENIILNDMRIYLEVMVRQIFIQLAKNRENSS